MRLERRYSAQSSSNYVLATPTNLKPNTHGKSFGPVSAYLPLEIAYVCTHVFQARSRFVSGSWKDGEWSAASPLQDRHHSKTYVTFFGCYLLRKTSQVSFREFSRAKYCL
jgi:hypothetical protein